MAQQTFQNISFKFKAERCGLCGSDKVVIQEYGVVLCGTCSRSVEREGQQALFEAVVADNIGLDRYMLNPGNAPGR